MPAECNRAIAGISSVHRIRKRDLSDGGRRHAHLRQHEEHGNPTERSLPRAPGHERLAVNRDVRRHGSDWGCSVSPCGPDHFVIADTPGSRERCLRRLAPPCSRGRRFLGSRDDGPPACGSILPAQSGEPGHASALHAARARRGRSRHSRRYRRRVRSLAAAVFEAGDHP